MEPSRRWFARSPRPARTPRVWSRSARPLRAGADGGADGEPGPAPRELRVWAAGRPRRWPAGSTPTSRGSARGGGGRRAGGRCGPHRLFPRDRGPPAWPRGPEAAGGARAGALAPLGPAPPPRADRGAGSGAGLGPRLPAAVGVAARKPRPGPAPRPRHPQPLPRLRGRAPGPLQPPRILGPRPAPRPAAPRSAPGPAPGSTRGPRLPGHPRGGPRGHEAAGTRPPGRPCLRRRRRAAPGAPGAEPLRARAAPRRPAEGPGGCPPATPASRACILTPGPRPRSRPRAAASRDPHAPLPGPRTPVSDPHPRSGRARRSPVLPSAPAARRPRRGAGGASWM